MSDTSNTKAQKACLVVSHDPAMLLLALLLVLLLVLELPPVSAACVAQQSRRFGRISCSCTNSNCYLAVLKLTLPQITLNFDPFLSVLALYMYAILFPK